MAAARDKSWLRYSTHESRTLPPRKRQGLARPYLELIGRGEGSLASESVAQTSSSGRQWDACGKAHRTWTNPPQTVHRTHGCVAASCLHSTHRIDAQGGSLVGLLLGRGALVLSPAAHSTTCCASCGDTGSGPAGPGPTVVPLGGLFTAWSPQRNPSTGRAAEAPWPAATTSDAIPGKRRFIKGSRAQRRGFMSFTSGSSVVATLTH